MLNIWELASSKKSKYVLFLTDALAVGAQNSILDVLQRVDLTSDAVAHVVEELHTKQYKI